MDSLFLNAVFQDRICSLAKMRIYPELQLCRSVLQCCLFVYKSFGDNGSSVPSKSHKPLCMSSFNLSLNELVIYVFNSPLKSKQVGRVIKIEKWKVIFLLLCWVGVHCDIYKSSYNISNISST
jgi:hypothetical protein